MNHSLKKFEKNFHFGTVSENEVFEFAFILLENAIGPDQIPVKVANLILL